MVRMLSARSRWRRIRGRRADANDTLRRCRVCDRHPRVGDWLRNIALPDGNVEHILCRPRARLR